MLGIITHYFLHWLLYVYILHLYLFFSCLYKVEIRIQSDITALCLKVKGLIWMPIFSKREKGTLYGSKYFFLFTSWVLLSWPIFKLEIVRLFPDWLSLNCAQEDLSGKYIVGTVVCINMLLLVVLFCLEILATAHRWFTFIDSSLLEKYGNLTEI